MLFLPEEIRDHAEKKDCKIGVDIFLSDLERQHIVNTLLRLDGNKSSAGEALSISLKTLYNNLNLTIYLTWSDV